MLASQPHFDEPLAPRESLLYIRRTLDAAGRLSSISGSGMVWVGILALAAVLVNYAITGAPWEARALVLPSLAVWAVLLVLSGAITVATMAAKARRAGQPFWSPVLRKALWSLSAPMATGAILSAALLLHNAAALLPVAWLACYGAALTSAGVVSVSPVRWMGISFLALALASLLLPLASGLAMLALGFGGLHIAFGGYIFWRHDG
jgi:hypothetical protein